MSYSSKSKRNYVLISGESTLLWFKRTASEFFVSSEEAIVVLEAIQLYRCLDCYCQLVQGRGESDWTARCVWKCVVHSTSW